jgi:hypothetical protein
MPWPSVDRVEGAKLASCRTLAIGAGVSSSGVCISSTGVRRHCPRTAIGAATTMAVGPRAQNSMKVWGIECDRKRGQKGGDGGRDANL